MNAEVHPLLDEAKGDALSRVRLVSGFDESQRAEAARIYWDAFGTKLTRIMGPSTRARVYLERALSPDHCFSILDRHDRLVAIAGFKSPAGALLSANQRLMAEVYGPFGAMWRRIVLRLLSHDVDNLRFLVDGIAVAPHARGRGLGTALLAALCDEARLRGYGAVRLEVVDTNPRARALYERQGFEALRQESIGALRHVFGFREAITMVKPLGA